MRNIFFALGTILILAFAFTILPIDKINWGRISILPAATITVTGSAQSDVANQMATFNATVTATNADKQTAIDKVNTQMTTLLKSLKDFGIADADIKTESISVNQMPVRIPQGTTSNGATTLTYPVPPQGTGNGDWQASNSVSITLRDLTKSSSLTDLLNTSGATNVYGPNLTTGTNTSATDADLLAKAVADAKSKAVAVAESGGQTLGKMINVQESGSNYSMPMTFATKDSSAIGSAPAPVQPGTSTLYKSVTVTYELK